MTPEEEILRSKLENMQVLVSAPTQFKGRLSELLSQMRMQRNQWHHAVGNGYTLDKGNNTFLSDLPFEYIEKINFIRENCRFVRGNENIFVNAAESYGFCDRDGKQGHEIIKNYHGRHESHGVTT